MRCSLFEVPAREQGACRAAASPLIKSAERACQVQESYSRSRTLTTLEAEYLELYNTYQNLVSQFRNGGASPGRSAVLQQDLVQMMGELSTRAKDLISLKSSCK